MRPTVPQVLAVALIAAASVGLERAGRPRAAGGASPVPAPSPSTPPSVPAAPAPVLAPPRFALTVPADGIYVLSLRVGDRYAATRPIRLPAGAYPVTITAVPRGEK